MDYSNGHIVNEVIVRIAGDGGEGAITTGEFFSLVLARLGLDVMKITSLPAEIRGGPAMIQVRVREGKVKSQGSHLDILVCFNNEGYQINKGDLKPDGILLYDPECVIDETNRDAVKLEVPLTEIARKEAGGILAKNMVALGALCGILDMDTAEVEKLIHQKFNRKGEKVVANNLAGLQLGRAYVREAGMPGEVPFRIEARPATDAILLGGNQAIALGALAAGIDVFAGYPITPATTILEDLAELLPRFGGRVIQGEDEIASLGMVLGASYAGAKAATSTSGPGLSLMSEEIGLASMAEIPCVLFDVQRGGPATGLPTKQEQSDLNIALYGSHGDAPRIVLAPATVRDCFGFTIEAFNLSEMCQLPTIFLSDFYLAQAARTMPQPYLANHEVIDRLKPTPEQLENYKRFALTDDGISPMAHPGDDAVYYVATGLEHNQRGNPDTSPDMHYQMSHKRHKKLDAALAYAEGKGIFTREYGDSEAELAFITWGSTEGALQEAIDLAADWGLPVAQLHLLLLNPLPLPTIQRFCEGRRRIVVAELNFTGQLAQRLRSVLDVPVESLTKCTGHPFTPYELLKYILTMNDWDKDRSDAVLSQVALVQNQRQVPVPTPGDPGQGVDCETLVSKI